MILPSNYKLIIKSAIILKIIKTIIIIIMIIIIIVIFILIMTTIIILIIRIIKITANFYIMIKTNDTDNGDKENNQDNED